MAKVNLPEGWCLSRITDIALKGEQRTPNDSEEFIYADIGSINRDLKVIESPQKLIGGSAPSRARKVIKSGDVLVSLTRPNLNAVALVPEIFDDQIASTGFEVIKPLIVESRYIFAITRSKHFIDAISGAVQGALYPAAKSSDVQGYEFPLPPLAEQKVIAEKLDTLLAQVDNTKARLERIPEILKRFRQSVLTAAISGKLTEDWRRGSAFKEDAVLFGSLVSESSVGLVRASGEQYEDSAGRHQYVKMNNIDNFWGHNTDNLKYVDASEEEVSKYGLEKGDWLFNTRNSIELVGKSCVWKGEEGLLYNNNILRVRFHDKVLADYVELFIKSPKGQQLLTTIKSGTTNVAAIYQKQLFQLPIDITELEEQTEIVRRVEELFAFADRIEHAAQAALSRVNNLTHSILAKAFRGELTADWRAANPELISGDNSAEALLERIKAERETIKNQPKTKSPAVKKKTGSRMSTQIIKVVEALKQAGEPLSGQQLLAAAGYPSDSSTDQLEQFFLDVREALVTEKSIVKLKRADDGQDWFAVAEPIEKNEEQS